MNRANVLAVAQAIEDAAKPDAKPKLGFCMAVFVYPSSDDKPDMTGHACETVACIAGWGEYVFPDAEDVFGLSDYDHEELTQPTGWCSEPREFPPARAVAVLRHLADTGVVDWSIQS